MKKIISLILTAMLAVTFISGAYAEESPVGYTPTDVLEWYEEGDEAAADASGQAANAVFRLVENLVYTASLNADSDQQGELTGILDTLTGLGSDEEITAEQQLGAGSACIARALAVLCGEADPEGVHADTVQGIIDEYNEVDKTVDSPEEQTVYALFTSVKLAALLVEESCTSQEQIDQVGAGLDGMDAENEAAADVYEQMDVGAKWLRKMLGAFAKLNNPDCIETVEEELARREALIAKDDMGPVQLLVQYLTSSMYTMGIFTGDYTLE